MNKWTLQFTIKEVEQQYFADQIKILQFFYDKVCWFGSLSSILVFILEFFFPIGFGTTVYFILGIPLIFYVTNRILRKQQHLFNVLLPLLSGIIGISFNGALLFDFLLQINFMVGQTIALVQLSLMLSTNFLTNITILVVNYLLTIIIFAIKSNEFSGYCVILSLGFIFQLLLAVVLMILSQYYQEYMKREYFLLKKRDEVWQNSMISNFKIQVLKLSFNERHNSLTMENTKFNLTFKDQSEFRDYLRSIRIIRNTSPNKKKFIPNKKEISKSISLEKYLYLRIQINQAYVDLIEGWNICCDTKYKIQIIQSIEDGKIIMFILIQKDEKLQKLKKLEQNLKNIELTVKELQKLIRSKLQHTLISYGGDFKSQLINYKFNMIQFLNSYFSICLNNYNYIQEIAELNLNRHFGKILLPFQQYFDLNQIKIVTTIPINLNIINDQFLLTHLLIKILITLIDQKCDFITIQVKDSEFLQFKPGNIYTISIVIAGKSTQRFIDFHQSPSQRKLISAILTKISPDPLLYSTIQQNQIQFEMLIFKDSRELEQLVHKF